VRARVSANRVHPRAARTHTPARADLRARARGCIVSYDDDSAAFTRPSSLCRIAALVGALYLSDAQTTRAASARRRFFFGENIARSSSIS